MTVTYSAKVATSNFSCFLKLLFRWRGSIYKLVWKDFAVFAAVYYILSFLYRFAMTREQQQLFERIANYCETYNNLIPVAFVLGFFVTLVIGRWWNQFAALPWPDRMALYVTATIHGHDDRGRLMRRTIMRYLCLAFVMMVSSISTAAKKRFPSLQHLTNAGFLLPSEQRIVEQMKTPFNRFFMPLVWATTIVARARKEGRIKDDFAVKTLIDEISSFRSSLALLFHYDWISVPLVYTQVVTIAVYTFFMSCLMGRQFLISSGNTADMVFPAFTFLQFFFYMGWLKVGESLINPFGEDDDDFDVNTLIDRHLRLSYAIVDEMHADHPDLVKDHYWDEVTFELPYTAASEPFHNTEPFAGSAANIRIAEEETVFLPSHPTAENNDLSRRFARSTANLSSDLTDGRRKREAEDDEKELPFVASTPHVPSSVDVKSRDSLEKRNKEDGGFFSSRSSRSSYSTSVDSLRKWWHSRHKTKQTHDHCATELLPIGGGKGEGVGGRGTKGGEVRMGGKDEEFGGKDGEVGKGRNEGEVGRGEKRREEGRRKVEGGSGGHGEGGREGRSVSIPIELPRSRTPSVPITMPLGGATRQRRKHAGFFDRYSRSETRASVAQAPLASLPVTLWGHTRTGHKSHPYLEDRRTVAGFRSAAASWSGKGRVESGAHRLVGSVIGKDGIGTEREEGRQTNIQCHLIHGILAQRFSPCLPNDAISSHDTINNDDVPSVTLAAAAVRMGAVDNERQMPDSDATAHPSVNLCCSPDQVNDHIDAISLMLYLASDAEDAERADNRLLQPKIRDWDAAGIGLATIQEADVRVDDDGAYYDRNEQSQSGDDCDDDDIDELQFLFSPSSPFDLGKRKHAL